MVQRIIKNERGYTIVEALIAVTVVSVILGIAFSIFVFANNQLNRWSSNLEFYNTLHLAQNQVYNDLLRAKEFAFSDTTLVILGNSSSSKIYSWKEGTLTRNKIPVNPSLIDSTLIGQNEPLNSEYQFVQWQLFQKSEKNEITLNQIMYVRRPVLWTSMRELD